VLPERLPAAVREPGRGDTGPAFGPGFCLDTHIEAVEARLLEEALDRADGDRAEAARLLGVNARRLRYLLQKHGSPADKN